MSVTAPLFDHLRHSDFQRLAAFIQDYAGIKMPVSKITMLEGRLRHRVRDTGATSLADYCRTLFEQDGLQAEAVHLIDAVTTNKTDFFREPQHFDLLARSVVPTLLADRHAREWVQVKLWSCACSTGAEPYTLAMVLADWCEHHHGLSVSILATDLSSEVLAVARRAIYPEIMATAVPAEFRHRYLLRSRDTSRPLVRIVPELRSRVKFSRLNLMDPAYSGRSKLRRDLLPQYADLLRQADTARGACKALPAPAAGRLSVSRSFGNRSPA